MSLVCYNYWKSVNTYLGVHNLCAENSKISEENVSSKVIQLHTSYLVTILVQLVELVQLAQLAELGGHHRHRLLLAKLFLSDLFYPAGHC